MSTDFENKLIDNGYLAFSLNHKSMKYDKPKNISTMENIDTRYFHKSDPILEKIEKGITLNEISWDDRKGEICFGLHERDKPPTLIYPRPIIKVKRIIDDKLIIQDQCYDDSMNVVLRIIPSDKILEAMYDNDIVFEIDLTK